MVKNVLAACTVIACSLVATANADSVIVEKVAENTTLGAKMFVDLTDLDSKTNGVKNGASGVGMDVKRFYLTVNHSFDEVWSLNLTTDFNYVSNQQKVTADSSGNVTQTGYTGETQLFIKKAFVQAKVADALWVRAGATDLPWIPFVEELYGYRYIDPTFVDRIKFGTSTDWGVHALGKFASGRVAYGVSVINGGGYKNPTRTQSMDVEGRLSFTLFQGLTAGLGFYSGKLGKDVEASATPAVHTATRFDALLAYKNDFFNLGGEYFSADNWTSVTSPVEDKADGESFWGSVHFTKQFAAFARYDSDKPNKDTAPDRKEEYFNAGLSMAVRKGVDMALAYKHDKVSNGPTTPSEYDEFGIWAQIQY